MTEQEIADLQAQVATLTTEKSDLQLEIANLQAQITTLEGSAETQGDRLTAALESVTTLTADRDLYKSANAALQRAIHAATASVPEMGDLTVQALTQIQEALVQSVQNMVSAMISQIRGR
jgi:chromosome segregation ATPase